MEVPMFFRKLVTPLLLTGFFYGGNALAQVPLSYVAITPCRIIDTRNATGPFGGPSLQPGATRTFPIPQGSCNIPSNAVAYSFNLAVVPQGDIHYVTLWPTGQSQPITVNINDDAGLVLSNFAMVAAGTSGSINAYTPGTTDLILDVYGYFLAQSSSTSTALGTGASNTGVQNTAVGYNALSANAANSNTAVGSYTLTSNGSGNNNVAVGASALFSNALGSANTAIGTQALLNNLVGNDNTSLGFSTLSANVTGGNNVALGAASMWDNVTGSYNTAVGSNTLYALSSGSWNIALGYQAGNLLGSGNNNIDIGNTGISTDSGIIRIGSAGSQSSAFIAGVSTTNITGVPVLINSSGQLGIASSSVRFKQDITAVGGDSSDLMKLRPVKFRYRQEVMNGSAVTHFGLIAEEVAKVYPELVVYDDTGLPFSIAYQELPSLLLSELQKQHSEIEEQRHKLDSQAEEIKDLKQRLSAIEQISVEKRQH